ncbi:LIV-I protein H [Hartmannibacter diazotrophicus]|uniref:LIV-I protein H n=1 Tax=Hartmannibacter diazotrophicus TaxID=1482074 RepID=A0A2C9D5X1_9HYPH|nr:urea ABC transporter permease subunit UrtB [Hartmannibacter diazotrophicus]SON55707.1 LIV-I protein H [Hartmannibacter diazotrophicus]
MRQFCLGLVLLCAFLIRPAAAELIDRAAIVAGLCGSAKDAGAIAETLLASTPTASEDDLVFARRMIDAVMSKDLLCAKSGGQTVVSDGTGKVDPVTGEAAEADPKAKAPVVSLKNRAAYEYLQSALTVLVGQSDEAKLKSLDRLARKPAGLPDGYFERAAELAGNPGVAARINDVLQLAALNSPDVTKRITAIGQLAHAATGRTLSKLEALRDDPAYAADPAFAAAVDKAVADVGQTLSIGKALSTLYNGLSFASILFMASIGLAIIFGLMGVINLAQGEFIMIGAYITYCTQELLRAVMPGLLDWYLFISIPAVFIITALIGVVIEATIIRHLYRRPLMSLLATWAISLFLSNLVRVTFGTQNLQMETPFYVTGGFPVIGDFIMTWNRLFSIGFATVTLAVSWYLIRRTGFGLDLRAVTQNRDMAGCIGIATRRVDRMAFGLGSGLAGLAGLALSPIYNVNPQMGTTFIIDSFMVVVLGGVGSIVGTVIAALGIGQINVLIEPIWGAVAAKVIVLGLIILFLQWRPEGLFVVAGRRK